MLWTLGLRMKLMCVEVQRFEMSGCTYAAKCGAVISWTLS